MFGWEAERTMIKQLTNRIPWIDTAKGIGLLCVIAGHLSIPYLDTWVYFFHMPLFFFLSGLVFSGGKYDFPTFLKKRLKSLVVPYFTLGGGIFLFFCVVYAVQGQPGSAYLDMLRQFLVQEHHWTVWFLACLFLTELLYHGIHRLFGKKPLVSTAVSGIVCAFGLVRYRLGWGSLPWNLDVALVAQFFFHAGFRFKGIVPKLTRFDSLRILPKLAAVGLMLGLNLVLGFLCIRFSGASMDMSVGWYGNVLLIFPAAFCGIAGVVLFARMIDWKWLNWLGRNTMVIFGWHSRIIIVLCGYLYGFLGIFQGSGLVCSLLYAAVTAAVIFAVLVPATILIKKSRLHALFGL